MIIKLIDREIELNENEMYIVYHEIKKHCIEEDILNAFGENYPKLYDKYGEEQWLKDEVKKASERVWNNLLDDDYAWQTYEEALNDNCFGVSESLMELCKEKEKNYG